MKHFPIHRGILRRTVGHVRAVDGVDLAVDARSARVGLVGESGSGKSTLGRVLAAAARPQLGHRSPSTAPTSPSSPERKIRALRRDMQMVFQDPYSSFDPLATVGDSLAEPLRTYLDLDGKGSDRARRRAARARCG